MNWHADEVKKEGGMFSITMEPVTNMAKIPASIWQKLAQDMVRINQKGVPVYLRLGHGMNGVWTTYGMRPIQYKTGFRNCAKAIREETNMTAMVWVPNVGTAYPFGADSSAQSPPPVRSQEREEFDELDTNKDGQITSLDDPYG